MMGAMAKAPWGMLCMILALLASKASEAFLQARRKPHAPETRVIVDILKFSPSSDYFESGLEGSSRRNSPRNHPGKQIVKGVPSLSPRDEYLENNFVSSVNYSRALVLDREDRGAQLEQTDEMKLEEWLRSKAIEDSDSEDDDLTEEEDDELRTVSDEINVVLTHITADFDSLASAVGLAKLWSLQDPFTKTYVVLPRGSHPIVETFLALHRNLFPIKSLKDIDKSQKVNKVGLVDASKKDRIKPALRLLDNATEIHIFNHHVGKDSDIDYTHLVNEPVGSVSTVITERLRAAGVTGAAPAAAAAPAPAAAAPAAAAADDGHAAAAPASAAAAAAGGDERGVASRGAEGRAAGPALAGRGAAAAAAGRLTDAEATLLALGVHADTGSLTFDSATPRDAAALAWLMAQGASMAAVSEFLHTALSPAQEAVFGKAFGEIRRTRAHGATVGTVLLGCTGYINGLARVAQNMLDLTNCDVLLMGAVYTQKVDRQANHMVVIGRARARQRAVNLHALFERWQGGGHPKAAAVSLRLDDPEFEGGKTPEEFMDQLVREICETQIKPEITAREFMTSPILTTSADEPLERVNVLLRQNDIQCLPVVDSGGHILGAIGRPEVDKALRQGLGERPVKGYMRTADICQVDLRTPLQEVTRQFVQGESKQVLVTEGGSGGGGGKEGGGGGGGGGKLAGMITRTDLLRELDYYGSIHYFNKAFSMRLDDPNRQFIMSLRKKLKKHDQD